MKRSALIKIIREEITTALMELTDEEKKVNVAAAQADVKAKEVALKLAQEKLKRAQAAVVD
jgi:hypothetical protein